MKSTSPQIVEIRARGSRLKVQCRVYESHGAMLAEARTYGMKQKDTLAYCEGSPSIIPKGYFAIVFFCRPYLSHGVIAHEFDHAAFCLMARRKHVFIPFLVDESTDEEEMHAGIVGDLVDDFHHKFSVGILNPLRGK